MDGDCPAVPCDGRTGIPAGKLAAGNAVGECVCFLAVLDNRFAAGVPSFEIDSKRCSAKSGGAAIGKSVPEWSGREGHSDVGENPFPVFI